MLSSPRKLSMTRTSFLIHLFGFISHCVGVYACNVTYVTPNHYTFAGPWKFLTVLTMYIAFFSTGFATFVDLLHLWTWSRDQSAQASIMSALLGIRDHLMSFWVFTTACTTTVLSNVIGYLDIDGVLPPHIQKIIPVFGWYNIYLHFYPMVYSLTAICLINYHFQSELRSFVLCTVLASGYTGWMVVVKQYGGFWPYPLLERLSTVQFIMLTPIASTILSCVVSLSLRRFASYTWDKIDKSKSQ